MNDKNSRTDDGAENAEWAKARADKHPTESRKNVNQGGEPEENDGSVDRSKRSKDEALAEADASRQGPASP
jgi:hypothetical protein